MVNKPKFLFIHGAGGTSNKWRAIPKHILEESIVINLPGRDNLPPIPEVSIENYAKELGKMLKNDEIVVGHSMGGLIAIELALKNSYVKGIVLVSSHYRLPVDQKVLHKLKEGIYPSGLFYASYDKNVDKSLIEQEEKEKARVSLGTSHSDFLATNNYESGKQILSNLKIPILAICGENDRLLPKLATAELHKVNSNILITVLKEAGHHVMLEKPKQFIEQLYLFQKVIY